MVWALVAGWLHAARAEEPLPDGHYDGTFPELSPDGRWFVWLRGEVAPRVVCVARVAAAAECLGGIEARWTRWLDAGTVAFGDAERWGTLSVPDGAPVEHALPPGARVHAVNRGSVTVEDPAGTFTRLDAGGLPTGPPVTLPVGRWPLLDAAGEVWGAGQVGPEARSPSWLRLFDRRGHRRATRWLWDGGQPDSWERVGRVVEGAVVGIDRSRAVGDHGAIERIDLATGAATPLAVAPAGQLTDVLLGPAGQVEAFATRWARQTWTSLDPGVAETFAWLSRNVDGDVGVDGRSDDDGRWLLRVTPGDRPTYAAVLDRAAGTLTRLPPFTGAAETWPWVPTQTWPVHARDGFEVTAYLTRPDPERMPGPRPLVVSLHGGPWGSRYDWGWDADAQQAAARGWSTLRVNFRGSGGHGWDYERAGEGEWTAHMRTDVYDAVAQAVGAGVADPARIALVGGSYGGYAVIAASILAPDVAQCGVSIVGPASVNPWLTRMPGLGHRDVQLGHRAREVGFPLLLVNGEADRIVPVAPLRRFAAAAVAAGRPVTLAVVDGMGHAQSEAQWRAMSPLLQQFLGACLGETSTIPALDPSLHLEVDGAGVGSPPQVRSFNAENSGI